MKLSLSPLEIGVSPTRQKLPTSKICPDLAPLRSVEDRFCRTQTNCDWALFRLVSVPPSRNSLPARPAPTSHRSDQWRTAVAGLKQIVPSLTPCAGWSQEVARTKNCETLGGVRAAPRRRDELGPARVNTCKSTGEGSELVTGDGMNSDHGKFPGFGRGPSWSQELG